MIDRERISRWLDDDLPTGERAAMQARMRDEPALRAEVERMRGLVDDLHDLPEVPPPAALDARVLARRERGPAPLLLLAAAAVGLALVMPREAAAPHIELARGVQVVDGRALVEAPWVDVDVDGRVRVAVEPIEPLAREGAQEGAMDRTHGLAALAGALVVVTVERGQAIVRADGAEEIVVPAGETHVVRGGRAAVAMAPEAAAPIVPEPGEAPSRTIERLQARVGELEAELREARQAGGIARGQLEVEQGTPSRWPDDVPDVLRPAAFEQTVRDAVTRLGGAVVETVDCAEYPCIAVIRPVDLTEDWPRRLKVLGDDLIPSLDDPSTSINVSRFGDGDKEAGLMAIAVARHGELERGTPVNQRTDWRGQSIIEGLAEELLGSP
ncbi:MAG TPA: hypothetical protein PKA64_08830 [Myxococcota bacterium]|nr:hypothetical protein [Myxococcota bacterium]